MTKPTLVLDTEVYRDYFLASFLNVVTGESACASPENFNADIGRKIARQNAVAKIWPLMGYELRQRLHEAALRDEAIKN